MDSDAPVTRLSLPSIPECTAWMTIEGKEAPLYGIEEQGNKTICYVESKTGQHFSIHFQDTRSSRSMGMVGEVHMYGKWQRARVVEREGPQSFFVAALRDGAFSERPFVFDNVKTTADEDSACADEAVHKGLGNINLLFKRWSSKTRKRSRTNDSTIMTAFDPALHEDSKKANVSLPAAESIAQLSFGKPQRTTRSYSDCHYNYIDKTATPFHNFEFRARSREILESQDLVPVLPMSRSPSEDSPNAGPSRSRSKSSNSSVSRGRSKSASNPLPQAPIIISDDEEGGEPVSEAELSRLEDELAELERQSRMAAIKRRISGGSTSSGVKREGSAEGSEGKKKVKLEKGGNGSASGGTLKGKGKEKEVLVLSDSA